MDWEDTLSFRLARFLGFVTALALVPAFAAGQVTPAAGITPPDDTPAIRLGATIYSNYTFQQAPTITDTDGNAVHRNSFDLSRAYINVTGNISHVIAFRITPDIARETNAASSLAGS